MTPPFTDLNQILEAACKRGPSSVVLACGQDEAALEALAAAEEMNLARAILVGDPGRIGPALDAMPRRLKHAEIVDAPDEESAVTKAVALVREGAGKVLLKGKCQTASLLHAVLDREGGLRTGNLLSDAFLFEYAAPEGPRLVCITDGGINLAPDLQAKKQIMGNAVALYHALGFSRPKVSILSAVETVIPGHPPSQDAVALVRMAQAGQMRDCDVDGPLSLDLSISMASAAKKGNPSPVAGRADILVCPDIVSANLLAKATTYFAHCRLGHVVMGAAAPVLIPSRADTAEAKLFSIALGVLVAG